MSRISLWLSLLALALVPAACASSSTAKEGEAGAREATQDKAKEEAAKKAETERSLAMANMRLEKTRLEMKNLEAANADALARAEVDAEMARIALANFASDSKLRVDRSEQRLQFSKDSFEEAKEELAQLEMMYKDQDLADKTREIVLRRGQRRLERAQAGLALDEREHQQLVTQTLPVEEKRLRTDLDAKERSLAAVRRQVEESVADKRIALFAAEGEVAKLQAEVGTAAAKPAK